MGFKKYIYSLILAILLISTFILYRYDLLMYVWQQLIEIIITICYIGMAIGVAVGGIKIIIQIDNDLK